MESKYRTLTRPGGSDRRKVQSQHISGDRNHLPPLIVRYSRSIEPEHPFEIDAAVFVSLSMVMDCVLSVLDYLVPTHEHFLYYV
jgi:hypothetical protein